MKKSILILFFLIPLMVSAQTSKTEKIYSTGTCTMNCEQTFNNDSLISAYVSVEAKDDRSATLKNYFTICYDTPQNVFKFLTEMEKFSKGNSGTPTELCGHRVEIENPGGTKTLKVWNDRGLIFHRFLPSQIVNARTKLQEWAVKNKVLLE
jgi:hypothetical protein